MLGEQSENVRLAVLMTCHNRREKTLACLRAFQRAAQAFAAAHFTIFLTDDGSTDGTADAVRNLGLDVIIIDGPGNLYWNRGMVRAWETAQAAGEFDGYLLLNDDVLLDPDAVERIFGTSAANDNRVIVVGATRDPITGEQTYGGVIRTSSWHPGRTRRVPASPEVQEADTFNANFVLIPEFVFKEVGMLDPTFHHGIGDFDYGLRANEAGIGVIVTHGTIGTCPRNDQRGTWRDPALPLRKRLSLLQSPKGLPRDEWAEYLRRHGGFGYQVLAWAPTLQVIRGSTMKLLLRSRPRGIR